MNGGCCATPLAATRIALLWFFLEFGILTGNWVSRIPDVRLDLRASTGTLGLVLVSAAVGVVCAVQFAGKANQRWGSRSCTVFGACTMCLATAALGLDSRLELFVPSLLLWGFTSALQNISMNAQAVLFEDSVARPVMGSFHGTFSVGGLCGALSGGVFASKGVSVLRHLTLVSCICLVVDILLARKLFTFHEERQWLQKRMQSTPTQMSPSNTLPRWCCLPGRTFVCLAGIAFLSSVGEGSMGDWSGIYLRSTLDSGPLVASFGYSAFSFAMAAGRFLGDYLQCKLGKKRLLFLAGLVASVSLGLAVLAPSLPLGQLFCIVGLGGTGCGLSVLIPVVFQSTGETSSDNPAAALAALSGCGYFGLVVGPPVLGGLSKATSLRYSLLVDAVLLSGIAWCARELPEPLVDRHKILEQRTYELVGDEGTAGERSLPEHQEVKFDARFCIDDTEAEVVSV